MYVNFLDEITLTGFWEVFGGVGGSGGVGSVFGDKEGPIYSCNLT